MRNAIPVSLAVALAALVLFTGCRGAVSKPDPVTLPPESTPSELLLGLWIGREERSEGEYNRISLTFTPERFIYTVSRYSADNIPRWARSESGTWTATLDTNTITKQETWYDFENDEEIYLETERKYKISDGELTVTEWDRFSNDDNTQSFSYVDSIPDIRGTFGHDSGLFMYDDNSTSRYTYEYVINQETFTETFEYYRDGALSQEWRIHGNIVSYDEDNLYMDVSITEFSFYDAEFTYGSEQFIGHKLRWAFAPAADKNRFFVSRLWEEQSYHRASRMWYSRADYRRYGDYWLVIGRK